jgi:hypothetical protein
LGKIIQLLFGGVFFSFAAFPAKIEKPVYRLNVSPGSFCPIAIYTPGAGL